MLVDVNYIGNLDSDSLQMLPENNYDFVILNHVLEHVANPIRAIEGIFRVLKVSGKMVLSVPDKDFQPIDGKRTLTTFDHKIIFIGKG